MERELDLRLRAERLITGFAPLPVEEAIGALADVEAIADALVVIGELEPEVSTSIVTDTVDALVVRGAPWVEPTAVDLDVRRLYDLAAGAPRPRLQRVVPAALPIADGLLTSVDLWNDRTEARVVDHEGVPQSSHHFAAIPAGDTAIDVRDGAGDVVRIDLAPGRAAAVGGSTTTIDAAEYVARLEAHARAAVTRGSSIVSLSGLRRRLAVVGEVLGAGGGVRGLDDAVATASASTAAGSALLAVVPVAARTPFGWLLSIERWTDHWRAVVADEGRALWTAEGGDGSRFGGERIAADVVRFDPALDGSVRLQRLAADGTSVDVDVDLEAGP